MSSVGDISGEEVTNKKAASAFRTIGEAADELGVPQHVLRFWEKRFGQLSPVKRRGRRYYRPEDLELLQQIKALLYQEGYTIKGVQKYLANEPNPDNENQSQQDLFGEAVEVGEVRTKPVAKKAPAFPGNDINAIPKQMLKTVLNKLHIANERLKDAL